MTYFVNVKYHRAEVQVTRKKIKTVRLKVFPTGEIKLSVPDTTPDAWIIGFIAKKQSWIEDKLNSFQKTRAIEKEQNIRSGTSTRILGKQIVITIENAPQKRILCEDSKLTIFTPDSSNYPAIGKQLNNWWQKRAKAYYIDTVDRLFPIIGKHGIDKPDIIVKKMSTLWGSCSRKHNRINLNYYLYRASRPCIEYVILHELIHFLYPRHNKHFYDFLTIYMPDWEERKKQLDYEIVLGV